MNAHLAEIPRDTPVELWFQDEARIGQKNGLLHQWARTGTRPRQPTDQRYDNAYLFGAICPAQGKGAALALPKADTEAMQLHINEISRHVAPNAHAVLLMDRAAWHTTSELRMPANITAIFLPSRSPELNPQENIWQYLRWLRAGELTAVWVPDESHEAMRDLVRARAAALHRKCLPPTGQLPSVLVGQSV